MYDATKFQNLTSSMDGSHSEHVYTSLTDNVVAVQAAGYFADYAERGPNRIGDLVHFKQVTLDANGNVATVIAAATLMVTAITTTGAATASLSQAFV